MRDTGTRVLAATGPLVVSKHLGLPAGAVLRPRIGEGVLGLPLPDFDRLAAS